MNHTIKGIIIAAAITSMLVLGATSMIPIMQNASARSINTNSNTNTATSDSDSTATATQSQEQDACAVAITCPEGSTTVTPTPPTSTCNPSTVGGITATPTDGTCTANSAGLTARGVAIFIRECQSIPGSTLTVIDETSSVTCTFPSTPPT